MRILDCQSWESIKDITNNVSEIKKNFDAVQIPPVQPHKNAGGAFWEVYQVNGFSIGNEKGTLEDIKELADTDSVDKVVKTVKESIYKDATSGNNMKITRRR